MVDIGNEVLEYLKEFHKSEDNAVSAGDLAILFNLTKRGLRSVVTNLRQDNYPVCSSNSGYWYSTNPVDIEKTVRRLEAQAEHMNKAVKGLKSCLGGGYDE